MAIRGSLISAGAGMVLVLTALLGAMPRAADHMANEPKERTLAHTRIDVGEYQSFLKNWDDKKHAVLYALIQTPAHYEALFHPAPVMDVKRPFAPDAALYLNEQILVIARVMLAPENMDRVFEVERISAVEEQLTLHYRFNQPQTNATFLVKNYLALRIPRHDYEKVIFVENGEKVGELITGEGQWCVPVFPLQPR